MADYRSFFDRKWLAAFELAGQDVTLTIVKAEGVTVQSAGGSAERKIGLHFAEIEKGFVCNTTNGTTIAAFYGPDIRGWIGRTITIFPAVTPMGGQMKDCIRVRPGVPAAPPSAGPIGAPPSAVGQVQTFSPGWPPPAQHAPAPPPAPAAYAPPPYAAPPPAFTGWSPGQPPPPPAPLPPPPVAELAPTAPVTPAAKRAATKAKKGGARAQ